MLCAIGRSLSPGNKLRRESLSQSDLLRGHNRGRFGQFEFRPRLANFPSLGPDTGLAICKPGHCPEVQTR